MQDNERHGPLMLAATAVLNPGPARISRLGPGIKLPRTVPIRTLISVGAGAILFLLPTFVFLSMDLRNTAIAAVLGGGTGWFIITYSPMKGESMSKWMGLEASARYSRKLTIDGQRAQAYIGICPITQLARGPIRIQMGHANVPAGSVDERGGTIRPEDREIGLLPSLGRRTVGDTIDE